MSTTLSERCMSIKLNSHENVMWHLKNCNTYTKEELKTMMQIVREMKMDGQNQLKLPDAMLIPLLIIYGIMIVFGTIGSFLVIFIVARNKLMRSPRNLFILNLAISDLILCIFTQPFNLLRLLSGHQEWNLGQAVCKMTSMFQGTNILVSTLSITAIALDRFHVIVHPEKPPIGTPCVVKILVLIWILSILISVPFFFFSKVYQEKPKKCFEALESDKLKPFRVAHAYLMLILQYVVPMVIVSVTYFRIYILIKYRMVNQREKPADRACPVPISQAAQQKRQAESRRQKKTNLLLASLAIIFALSWLPLNTVNIVMDFKQNSFDERQGLTNTTLANPLKSNTTGMPLNNPNNNSSHILSIQAICLLIVLSSACANPVLYGWLNDNFKREFKLMFKSFCSVCPTIRKKTRNEEEFVHLNANTTVPAIGNNKLKMIQKQETNQSEEKLKLVNV